MDMKYAFSLVSIGFIVSRILADGMNSKTILCSNKLNVCEVKKKKCQEAFQLPFANCDVLIFYARLMSTRLFYPKHEWF